MTFPDIITVGGFPFGAGFSLLLFLAPPDWREKHRTLVSVGRFVSFTLMAFGLLVITTYFLPTEVHGVMLPKFFMISGIAIFGCGAVWQFSMPAGAQSVPTSPAPPLVLPDNSGSPSPSPPPPASAQPLVNSPAEKSIVGADIIGHSQGGDAATIINGTPGGPPSVGADIHATGCGNQSVTGLRVEQDGPGTGLRVIQNGPGIGMRVTVEDGGPNCAR